MKQRTLNKKEQQAINVFIYQLNKLEGLDKTTCYTWIAETRDYLRIIFGEQSDKYLYLKDKIFYFTDESIKDDAQIKERIPEMKGFINSCIDTIKNVGIYRPFKPNFIYFIENKWMITIIIAVVSAAYLIGKETGDKKEATNIQFKNNVDVIQDSIKSRAIFSPPANNIPQADTASHQ